jgi:hypothetical protein
MRRFAGGDQYPPVAVVDQVLARLIADREFRQAVAAHPQHELAECGLSDAEQQILTTWLFGTSDSSGTFIDEFRETK